MANLLSSLSETSPKATGTPDGKPDIKPDIKSGAKSGGKTPAKAGAKSAKPAARKSSGAEDADSDSPAFSPKVSAEDALPSKEEIAALLAPVRNFMHSPRHARVRGFLQRLALRPPQVLLMEGGTVEDRLAAAHLWALLLNCPTATESLGEHTDTFSHNAQAGEETPDSVGVSAAPAARKDAEPCLDCPECVRMVTHLHRDCFFLDGLAASIKIDDVRAVRNVLGEPPREARYRVVIFREAQALVEAAANALLKSFEEPRPATTFVMLAPQRERLLPTLVSRSITLTLPWPLEEDAAQREALAPWEAALCTFLQSGRGWFERTGTKGSVDVALVHALTNLCRRALASRMAARQSGAAPREGLEQVLARLPDARLRMLDEALAECQDSITYGVNPVLVLEWLATRMYLLIPR